MSDKYYVYRPLLDLIGRAEGTDIKANGRPGRGYNETLSYGAFTGGNVDLVSMSLADVDKLQTSMLRHPSNKLKSSAAGRYQIVRTTKRDIENVLSLKRSALFDEDMQDRMACFLLGKRGIDKWLDGRMKEETLINNLSAEWASLPRTNGKGTYEKGGASHVAQGSRVSVEAVRSALLEVKRRRNNAQPANIPEAVKDDVKKGLDKAGWIGTVLSGGGLGLGALVGFGWEQILAITGGLVVLGVLFLIMRKEIFKAIKEFRDDV